MAPSGSCALCGHPLRRKECQPRPALNDGRTVTVCNAPDHDCWDRWTRLGERPLL